MISYKHHIIPKHEWKKRFGTLRGVDAGDNVVWLTLEQHIECHKWLWDQYGRWEDFLALNMLSGHIGKEALIYLKQRFSGKDRILTEDGLRRLREAKVNVPNSEETNTKISKSLYSAYKSGRRPHPNHYGVKNPFYGRHHTIEYKEKKSKNMKGIPKQVVTCPYCGNVGGKPIMYRFHFNNCKRR